MRRMSALGTDPPISSNRRSSFSPKRFETEHLIRQRRFVGREDVLDGLAALRGEKRTLLVKPHPWDANNAIVTALSGVGGKITNSNTYALLASPEVEVVTLSSSVGQEARAFGAQSGDH